MEWCVSLRLPADAPQREISQTWDLDDEPDVDDLPPSEVIEIISQRLEHYLFSTGREEDRKVIAWVRANAARLDAEWAASEAEQIPRRIVRLQGRLEELHEMQEQPCDGIEDRLEATALDAVGKALAKDQPCKP